MMRSTTGKRDAPTRFLATRPMFPEGVISPLLLTGMMAVAGFCVDQSGWSMITTPIVVVAMVATVFGCVVSKLRMDDAVAHALAIFAGFAFAVVMVLATASSLGPGIRSRTREF